MPFNQKVEKHTDDQVSRILKYLYNSQNIDCISEEITEQNYYSLYAQAFALKCDKLLKELTKLAITSLLTENNVCHMFHDAVEHQDAELAKACTDLLVQRFEIAQEEGIDRQFLLELDIENFVSILESDKLNIINENVLTDMVKEYIKIRVDAKPVKELPPEQTLKPELWNLLSEQEKENRRKQFADKQQAEKNKAAETRDQQSKVYQALDKAKRIQFILDLKQQARNDAIEAMLKVKPLKDEDKLRIFRAIRWTYMSHEELLKLSMDPDFSLAKSMIMQGLSCKLDPNYAQTMSTRELLITVKPRDAV